MLNLSRREKNSFALPLHYWAPALLFVFSVTTIAADCETSWKILSREEKARVAANKAGLHFVSAGEKPGYTRLRKGRGFRYKDPKGKEVRDPKLIERLDQLQIPPGYKNVWISTDPRAHIQATAIDDKGRTQYRYHLRWIQTQSNSKFDRTKEFGQTLPNIRKDVAIDLKRKGLPKEKVLALLVRLLDKSYIRIGNESYARENASFGLTTFRKEHVILRGDKVLFDFIGKSGQHHLQKIEDPTVASIVKELKKVRGENLFQYLDEEGYIRAIASDEVNDYLKTLAKNSFTAKDFRTWGGSVAAMQSLLIAGPAKSAKEIKVNIKKAIEFAAATLENTPSVAEKNYIHPKILEAYRKQVPMFSKQRIRTTESTKDIAEKLVLELLEKNQ